MVWAPSLSLAATQKIVITFFSSGYLDVSVHRVPLIHYLFMYTFMLSQHVSSLIRISAVQSLLAAPRSFSQPATSFFGAWCLGILPMLFVA